MSRLSRDDFWYSIAAQYATRATCPRASIGAVLVKFDRLISAGFNGAAPGQPHCLERQQTLRQHLEIDHCAWSVHAERNAIYNAWVQTDGATLYVVGPRPICPDCRDYLRSRGVTDIRHRHGVATLDTVLAEVAAWQAETFPDETVAGKTLHLLEELAELEREPESGDEMADVVMLLTDVARARGIDLVAEITRKLSICRQRTWAPPDENGVIRRLQEARS